MDLYRLKHKIFAAIMCCFGNSLAYLACKKLAGVKGIIFTGHHVLPQADSDITKNFVPNRMLELTPAYLEEVIEFVLREGYKVVPIEQVPELLEQEACEPFVVFTFDDGYLDNMQYALPVFEKYQVPFCIYITTSFMEGEGVLWWRLLEQIILDSAELSVDAGSGMTHFSCASVSEKYQAWNELYWPLRAMEPEKQRKWVLDVAESIGFDCQAYSKKQMMNWDQLVELARHPLVSIGAHSLTHPALARLSMDECHYEIVESGKVLEDKLGVKPVTFSYPIGDRGSADEREFVLAEEAGYASAVTTRKNSLSKKQSLFALPRVSLNGYHQNQRFIKAMFGGVLLRLWAAVSS